MIAWALVLLAAIGWTAGVLFFGLWLGERGRRKALERWIATGQPTESRPAEVFEPTQEAEDRMLEAAREASEQAVERGAERLRADYKAAGYPVPGDAELRDMARRMHAGENIEVS